MAKNQIQQEPVSPNQINAGTIIHGNIVCNGNIRIDGNMKGKIECSGKVVIGNTAVIEGDIVCANLDMMGQVTGNIFVAEKTALKATARLMGDLQTGTLSIEPGSEFNGKCTMAANLDLASMLANKKETLLA
ncbi:MAG: polymer-forming cytoskeletal protein [Flavobacteriales bacterium]|nr:polymer-forming cytoskeletal protein [Flavobacteriales bacterium]